MAWPGPTNSPSVCGSGGVTQRTSQHVHREAIVRRSNSWHVRPSFNHMPWTPNGLPPPARTCAAVRLSIVLLLVRLSCRCSSSISAAFWAASVPSKL